MAEAVLARWRGDLYQSRLFWREACKLFHGETRVVEVHFEAASPRGFDDLVVRYDPPIMSEQGREIRTDCYQVKFHEDYRSEVTWRSLIDPEFINRERQSLLGSLLAVCRDDRAFAATSQFTAITPWRIASGDPLGRLVRTTGGSLSIETLRKGTTSRSATGKVRTTWREHLALANDEELFELLQRFRLQVNAPDIVTTLDELDRDLRNAGLAPVQAGAVVVPYDDLLQKLRLGGRVAFTRSTLRPILERESLWRGGPVVTTSPKSIGVRSFVRGADAQTGKVDELVDLTKHFDGRRPRASDGWQSIILPAMSRLAEKLACHRARCTLHFAAHASIAFALGYHLDAKVGVVATVVQPSVVGPATWEPATPPDVHSHWDFTEAAAGSGPEVAVAVGISHDIFRDVCSFVAAAVPGVGRVLCATIRPRPTSLALRGGSHALGAVQELVAHLRATRSYVERASRLHIFLAAPNGFSFFLGQHAHALGQIQLYEHDLEAGGANYSPSIALPAPWLASRTENLRR